MQNANRAKWEGAGGRFAWRLGRDGAHLWPSSPAARQQDPLTHARI